MDEQLQQEIDKLLEHLESQEDTATSQPSEGWQETEVIDVFIVHRQVGEPEPPTVESTLAATCDEQETQAAPLEQETTEEPALPPLSRKPRRRTLPFVAGALCVLAVGLLSAAALLMLLAPSATVTIIPASAQITSNQDGHGRFHPTPTSHSSRSQADRLRPSR